MAANNDAPPFTNIRTLGVKAFDLRKNNRAILISAINLYRKLVISIYRYYYSIAHPLFITLLISVLIGVNECERICMTF